MKSLTVVSFKIPNGFTFKNGKIVQKFKKVHVLKLALSQDISGQTWKIDSLGGDWYRLINEDAPRKALDIINDANDNKLQLTTIGAYSGQYWKFTKLHSVPQGTA